MQLTVGFATLGTGHGVLRAKCITTFSTLVEMVCTDRFVTNCAGIKVIVTKVVSTFTTTARMLLTVVFATRSAFRHVFQAVWLVAGSTVCYIIVTNWVFTDRTVCRVRFCDLPLAVLATDHVSVTSRSSVDSTGHSIFRAQNVLTGDTLFSVLLADGFSTGFAVSERT